MTRTSPLPLSWLLLATLVVAAPACGKRGPPLPPLRPSPDFVGTLDGARQGSTVTFTFTTPAKNTDGSTPVVFDHVEVFAMTVAAGSVAPTRAEVLKPAHRIGVVHPPAVPKPAPDAASAEPAPPVVLTFTETLPTGTAPVKIPPPQTTTLPAPVASAATAAAPASPAPAAPAGPPVLKVDTRFYAIVPFATRSRAGYVSEVSLPLDPPPAAPAGVTATYDEQTIHLAWTGAAGQHFRVYAPGAARDTLLTPAPIADAAFSQPVVFGREACFVVRAVTGTAPMFIESAASTTACVTPVDTFPPSAPTKLLALATEGAITLTWEGVSAADLAGYLVLRGEGAGERLQPLMTTPVMAASFEDKTAKVGVKYVYAVVAVDKAGNRSAESNRVEETGR